MAKRFGGFTPEQQQILLSKMGYDGPAQQDDINKFMMASPKAASMMGRYTQMAKARVEGGPQVAMAKGGYVGVDGKTYSSVRAAEEMGGGMVRYVSSREAAEMSAAQGQAPAVQTVKPVAGNPYAGEVFSGKPSPDAMAAVMPAVEPTPAADVTATVMPAVEPTPVTTLPEMPTPASAEDVTPFTSTAPRWAQKGLTDLLASGKLPDDPTKFTVTGSKGNYVVEYADGTKLPVTMQKYDDEGPVIANQIAGLINQYKESDVYKGSLSAQEQYTQQVEQYKQYQQGQAGAATADPRTALDAAQLDAANASMVLSQYTTELANMAADDPRRESLMNLIEEQQIKVTQANANVDTARRTVETVGMPSLTEMKATALEAPEELVTKAEVAKFTEEQRAAGKMAEGTGQAGAAATADTVKAAIAGDVVAPEVKAAAKYDAETVAAEVQATLDQLQAATGMPSEQALAEAQTMDPKQLAQLGLSAAQIEQAVQVQAPAARTVQEGELIAGTTVDMARAEQAINFEAATGVPSTEATVQGQLTQLLSQFEGGQTPPWAAGAMRAATATLAARGLAASSMAGQAVVQAAMESALPIAQQDAATRAQFEAQNLSNRQQTAMFAAEQRAKFLGMEFDQAFQTRVQNAAKISDIANMNFSAEVQVALENARLAQSVDLANLSASNAKIIADAAAMTQTELAGLNNRQQAAIQNAQSFLQMDMTNLANQQQVAIFKAQGNIQSLITDAAAVNAAAQFNASSENQTNQFYDNLVSQVSMFNNEQKNAMERFNADQANAIAQFNAAQKNARDQFNASQALVVAQANAQWDQAIATAENAAQNQANRDAAMEANRMTQTTYDAMLQQERDVMDYAWRTIDNALARDANLTIAEMQTQAEIDKAKGAASGSLLGKIIDVALPIAFGK